MGNLFLLSKYKWGFSQGTPCGFLKPYNPTPTFFQNASQKIDTKNLIKIKGYGIDKGK